MNVSKLLELLEEERGGNGSTVVLVADESGEVYAIDEVRYDDDLEAITITTKEVA